METDPSSQLLESESHERIEGRELARHTCYRCTCMPVLLYLPHTGKCIFGQQSEAVRANPSTSKDWGKGPIFRGVGLPEVGLFEAWGRVCQCLPTSHMHSHVVWLSHNIPFPHSHLRVPSKGCFSELVTSLVTEILRNDVFWVKCDSLDLLLLPLLMFCFQC